MVRVGLVHDWVVDLGGAEKCLQSLHNIYPDAPLFTLFYRPESLARLGFKPEMVYTSALQDKRNITSNYRWRLPVFPYHIEQLRFDNCDIVLSSSHCVAKGVMAKSDQLHICYCHTPASYAWDFSSQFLSDYHMDEGLKSKLAHWLLHYLRLWDVDSTSRVDYFIANSQTVAQRIWRAYRRRAQVIYPPVEVDRYFPAERKDRYFLLVSRLVPNKRVPLVIETFNQLGLPLKVVGDGPQLKYCQQLAGKNVEVLGYIEGSPLAQLMSGARALIFPAEDAFGIVPVEAQAAGTPVIALARGGARETVVEANGHNWEEATGIFFNDPSVESLSEAIKQFKRWEGRFQTEVMRSQALKFSQQRYEQEISDYIQSRYQEWLEERII
ncbi:MAG: glycosyltransferase [Methylocystaceae bacterium]